MACCTSVIKTYFFATLLTNCTVAVFQFIFHDRRTESVLQLELQGNEFQSHSVCVRNKLRRYRPGQRLDELAGAPKRTEYRVKSACQKMSKMCCG